MYCIRLCLYLIFVGVAIATVLNESLVDKQNKKNMDSNKDITYYEHQYETICNSLKNANFDDVTNPEISANKNRICERTQSINKSNNKNIVNLDCNRIRDHKRLTKILPRPSSLPNSLNNLMKTAFSTKTPESKPVRREEIPLNIKLIKKLEDEIYKRRELSSGEPKIIWKFDEDCSNSKDISFIKNSSAFNSKNNPVLMIDTWKLDPLLMKYSKDNLILKPPPSAIASTSISDGQSILIVDNSKFYPVIMKYEINSSAIENGKSNLLIESQTRCDKIIIPSNRKNINNLNDEENCCIASTSTDDDKNISKGKISKFKRFIMQRRSLNLSLWKKNSNKTVHESVKQKPKINSKNNLNNEKIPPNTLRFIFKEYFDSIEKLFKSKNNKNIFWQIKHLTKQCNLNDLFNIYLKEFSINQQSTKFMIKRSKTCIDLTNFSDKIKKCDKNFYWSDSDLDDINKMCKKIEACKIMPMKIIQRRPPPLSRNVKFRSSFRLKRHSVGSTDVVKTWVYRRRCLCFLFF